MFTQSDHRGWRRGSRVSAIELFVVVTIIGIMATIVGLNVAGVPGDGRVAACRVDTSALRTAEEAVFASSGNYQSEAALVSQGLLSNVSRLHNVVLIGPIPPSTDADYSVVVEDRGCGQPGHIVGQTGRDF